MGEFSTRLFSRGESFADSSKRGEFAEGKGEEGGGARELWLVLEKRHSD